MKAAIVGGTGFVGRHLARRLLEEGHQVVVLARGVNQGKETFQDLSGATLVEAPISDTPTIVRAINGCDVMYSCAGINREKGEQTFHAVHVAGTRSVLSAMRQARLTRLIHISFLRACARTDSSYHVSKWQGEEAIRSSGMDYTIFRPGVIYGEGDQFLTNLKRTLNTLPFFGLVGLFRRPPIAPLWVDDLTRVLVDCVEREDTFGKTYPIVGPEKLTLGEVVDLAGDTIDIIPNKLPLPLFIHRVSALLMDQFMDDPLLTNAQLTMLSEDLTEPDRPWDELPAEFKPRTKFLKL